MRQEEGLRRRDAGAQVTPAAPELPTLQQQQQRGRQQKEGRSVTGSSRDPCMHTGHCSLAPSIAVNLVVLRHSHTLPWQPIAPS